MLEHETSQIKRALPALIRAALHEREITEDEVLIATDTDLDVAGEYAERWLVVTKEHVLVFMVDDEEGMALIVREIPIHNIETARTDSRVGSGFLEAKTGEEVFEEIVRFSNKNADKFSKVAAMLRALVQGKKVEFRPEEEELFGRCQKCGKRLVDKRAKICPGCLRRDLVFIRFLKHVRKYWPLAGLALGLVLLTILIQLVPPQLTRVLLDNVFGDQPMPGWLRAVTAVSGMETVSPAASDAANLASPATEAVLSLPTMETRRKLLIVLVASLAVTTVFGAGIGWLREMLANWINNRLGYDLRRDVFQKMQDLAIRYHDIHPVGQLMTRCSQDVEALQGFVNQITSGFGYQIIMVVAVAFVMFATDWKLALIAIVPAPFVMMCTIWYYRRVVPKWQKYWTTRSSLANNLHGALNGIRVIKAFAQESREAKRFGNYSARFREAGIDVGYVSARFYAVMGFVFQWGSYFVWLFGGYQVLRSAGVQSDLTVGTLVAFLGYLGMFYAPLNALTQMSTWFTSFTTQAHRVFEVLDEESEIEETQGAVDIEIQGAIAFKNVTFGYDANIPVLHDISFHVKPGEMVGIVGHSGSGKSTTVNLVMRFYDPNEGTIMIDNMEIRKIRKGCLRRQIGLVAQDSFLFRGTIADNIAYGNPDVAPELILNAALAANAHMFITRIHDGYDTRLGEHGSGLSGGERQRVAIARGLLHNPRVLILDEATSSVDTISELEIQKALESLSLGRTTIAIAHRLSTLRNCDRILVFEEGILREQGTHEELLALRGIYHKLVQIQTQLTSDRDTSVDSLKAQEELQKAEEVKERHKPEQRDQERPRGPVPALRHLDPKKLHCYGMDEGGLHVAYGTEEYEHVRAYRCFPISHPSEFIALWTGASALEHQEVGVIRRLKELAPSSRLSLEHELSKRYFIHYIKKINAIKEELGTLMWEVETDKGDMTFMTRRWDRDTVIEGGVNSRIMFDIDNARFMIEDMDALDEESRMVFQDHVFW